MAVGVYLRVSTEDQRERQSIATQREFGERYCQLHNLTVYRVYADDAVSGTIPLEHRPDGSQILQDARGGKFDQLLVYRLDRLGRDTRLILNGVAELESHGVRVRSMTEEFDTGTPGGRLMLTMLSGFAAHEREVIRERSLAGTNRVAEAGAWLGGIVPYGFRKEGERSAARLVISDEPIAGLPMSEAEVVRMIYRLSAVERQSCQKISNHLNCLAVPCAYVRDERAVLRGKRKQRTSGLWRPGRVRNLIVSTTYMGLHQYGKRSRTAARKLITRTFPAIVTQATWEAAQKTLKSNQLFSARTAVNRYLLRGKVKCALCGLTYIGTITKRPSGRTESYYKCNGKHGARGLYGANGLRCPAKDLNGTYLENVIWEEVEGFLRNPGAALQEIHRKIENRQAACRKGHDQLEQLELALRSKAGEKDRVVSLFRRGRIDEAAFERQMREVENEEADLKQAVEEAKRASAQAKAGVGGLAAAGDLLVLLRSRLNQPVSWELKRSLVEVLVGEIKVNTLLTAAKKEAEIAVTYRFASPTVTCTDRDSSPRPA